MRRALCCLSLLVAVGCSQSPTAPTSSPSLAAQLQWNVTSAACAPVATPPSQPTFAAATIVSQPDGAVIASWPYDANGRNQTLYARFVRENGSWAMCSWDIADI